MIQFVRVVTRSDIASTSELAASIWLEHYPTIIGMDQTVYMIEKFQSEEAIIRQIGDGYIYYLLKDGDEGVGYFALKFTDEGLFISKFYVAAPFRGRGHGRAAMNFIERMARKKNVRKLYLTVNRGNTQSIAAYLKMGFVNSGNVVSDIGGGYVMDDYKLVKVMDE